MALSSVPAKRIVRPRIPVIRYEDNWVCVNKPAGMTVHRSTETWSHSFVVSTSLKRQLKRKVFPVHRLDHRTSGALLFAFDSGSCAQLQQRLSASTKRYVCLVRGEWTRSETEVLIDHPIKMKGIEREAQTRFRLLATQKEPRSSLVLAEPLTGRTHQIRKHAFRLGHPIIGDTAHGDTTINRWWRQNRNLDRLALHCFQIDFEGTPKEKNILAPLPDDFASTLRAESTLWSTALRAEPLLDSAPFDIIGQKKNMMEVDESQEQTQ